MHLARIDKDTLVLGKLDGLAIDGTLHPAAQDGKEFHIIVPVALLRIVREGGKALTADRDRIIDVFKLHV